MQQLYNEDKNKFWKFLKSLKQNSNNIELPRLDDLMSHFKNLYMKENTPNKIVIEKSETEPIDETNIFSSLNDIIREEETSNCIKIMKNNKAPGYDQITNEMLKCTNNEGIKLLTKLFNKILKLGIFPSEWNYGLLLPIHKGDDCTDANNFRGITLNSCLGKLFCTVLYQRLSPLLEKENIYCKEQAGFRTNFRTTDHIFLLKNIVRLYTKQNKHLYTCFVDFSKAFDSIVRQELIQKLSRIGIQGEFLNIIKSIYETTTNSLLYKDNITTPFTSNIGVKQGDTLSTILFNLYINDLPEIFNFDENHPITISNTNISCMNYADDLIIMSTSPKALQQCLNNLETYCKKWKLDVNIKKLRLLLIINKAHWSRNNHTFTNHIHSKT